MEVTPDQRALIRQFLSHGGMDLVKQGLKEMIFPDLVSTDAERRAQAAAAYRSTDLIAQVFRGIAKDES